MFAPELKSSHNERTVAVSVGNVDHAQVTPCKSLTECHARTIGTGAILSSVGQYLSNLTFRDSVIIDVGFAGVWVFVKAKFHATRPLLILRSKE